MSIRSQVARNLDVTVIKFSGRLSLGEGAKSFRDAVRDAVWHGNRKFALDYSDISYQDSTGNGELVSAFTIVANSGGELVLFDLTKRLEHVLKITKLYTVFRVFDSRDSALAYFDSTRDPEVQVKERRYFQVSVLEVAGALIQQFGAPKVQIATQTALNSGAKSVILLCPQVLEIDRGGAESLMEAQRSAREHGGEMVLAGIEERLLPALCEAGIADKLSRYETVDEALEWFGLKVDRSQWRIQVTRAD